MRLDKCLVVESVSVEELKNSYSTCSKAFPQYAITMQFPCEFMETVDNPRPIGFRDAEESNLQKADCGFLFELKNCNHQNFNVKLIHFNGKIYIFKGVYQYANYVADQVANFLNSLKNLSPDQVFVSEPYKSWCDEEFKKESLVLHNYKVDKEDLNKLGLSV
jgi:hypothetical protein